MRLTLVRHGRPDEAANDGPHDPSLDALGREQAANVARVLAREGVTRIVSSPLRRAWQTAQPLSTVLDMPVDIIDGWAEADRHLPRYVSAETLRRRSDAEFRRFLADPLAYIGADPGEFRATVLGALAATLAGPEDGVVAVFTHGLPINVVLTHVLGLPRVGVFGPFYASLTRLRGRAADELRVVSINEAVHGMVPGAA